MNDYQNPQQPNGQQPPQGGFPPQPPAGYGYGQPDPQFAQPPYGYGQPPMGWQQPPAGYAPAYGQPDPQFAQPPYGYGQPPMGWQQPPAGYAPAGYTPQQPQTSIAPAAPTPPPSALTESPLMSDEELSEDQFVTGGDDHSFIQTIPVPPHPATQFDEKKFLTLLAASISLTKTEKQRIISSIPKLSQYQIDELMRIFEEEQRKFTELNAKHTDELKKIEESHKNDWNDIAAQAEQAEQKKKDEDAAAKLRASLGLGGAANDNTPSSGSLAA